MMSNTDSKKATGAKKATQKVITPSKPVHFGDGVTDVAKTRANEKMQGIASMTIDMVFDYIESKVKDIPESIKRLRDNPKTKKEVAALWSDQLYEQGIISNVYKGMADENLIHNFRQEGYFDGLYVGHLLTMVAMTQYGIPWEDCKDIGNSVSLDDRIYKERIELIHEMKDELREYANQENNNHASDGTEE